MSADHRPLSDDALADLFARMKEAPRAVLASEPWPSPPQRRVSMAFEGHPLYQQIVFQRSFAEFAKLRNPYYRLHDAKAGAMSVIDGKDVINFASYDYLGLNGHPAIAIAVANAIDAYGSSVSASRITAGERPFHRALEGALAQLYQADDSIAYVSGHAGAVSTVATLMGPRDLILHDALIHNCVVVGAQLAGSARRAFPHNDLEALQAILATERHRFERVLIISEGLFSMNGDGPDLAGLIALKHAYACWLMIDDAHGLGVLGATGRGIFEHQSVSPQGVDLWLGTLSKSLVSCGGYVAGCSTVIDLLKHHAPGFVYSVGMPASNAVAASVALELMLLEPQRVAALQRQSQRFLEGVRKAGLGIGKAWGFGVVPIVIGETVPTVTLAERLLNRGINAFPVVPPGVPEKSARLRFFINATHTEEQIDTAVEILVDEMKSLGEFSLNQMLRP